MTSKVEIWIECDKCADETYSGASVIAARSGAKKAGWVYVKDGAFGGMIDVCPKCQGKTQQAGREVTA